MRLDILSIQMGAARLDQLVEHLEEFAGMQIALIMGQKDAISGQFLSIAPHHDIEKQATIGHAIERRCEPRIVGWRCNPGTHGHQKLQLFGMSCKICGKNEGFFAGCPGRDQHAGIAEPIDGLGNLAKIAGIGRATEIIGAEIGTITGGRDEPEEIKGLAGWGHGGFSLLE